MPKEKAKQSKSLSRLDLIKQIEKERQSTVICYITGDKGNFHTRIGEDVIPILFRHLELIGEKDNIDLLLYTRGGDMVTPIRIVKLIRSYCKKFSLLIPYRANSAGTLIALGADEIVMGKLGELSPVDPTTTHRFNPRDSAVDPKKPMPISVEDITSYLLFAKERGKVRDEEMGKVYENLTKHSYSDPKHLHPLALGNVYRTQRMSRILSERLLSFHIDVEKKSNKETIEKIVKEITSDICIHNYPIYRDEGKTLGLNIIIPENKLEKMLWSLYEKYAEDMELTKPFNPFAALGTANTRDIKLQAAHIESRKVQDTFFYYIRINKVPPAPGQPPIPGINVNRMGSGWEKVR